MLRATRRTFHSTLYQGLSMPRKYVSLGGWCGPALILGKLGLRTEAYPFDFLRVTMDGVLHFVENGFDEGFYPPGRPPYTPECVGPWVLFRGQHTAFAHFDLNSPEVQAHFKLRFDRFHRLLDAPERPITFFRTVTARFPQEELRLAHTLEHAIARRNPSLDFRLVLMVHDQGLAATAVELQPLSPRVSLWALRYSGGASSSLFDRTHDAYQHVVQHSADEATWAARKANQDAYLEAWSRPENVLRCSNREEKEAVAVFDVNRKVLLADGQMRDEDVSLTDLTAERFPWRCHDNLALIDGVASVGGTCAGIGSAQMLYERDVPWRPKKCRYCGDATFHAAGKRSRTERPFTEEEDALVLTHLYKVLPGRDKVAAVEQLAHEMHRGAYKVICRLQFLINASTNIMDSADPPPPSAS